MQGVWLTSQNLNYRSQHVTTHAEFIRNNPAAGDPSWRWFWGWPVNSVQKSVVASLVWEVLNHGCFLWAVSSASQGVQQVQWEGDVCSTGSQSSSTLVTEPQKRDVHDLGISVREADAIYWHPSMSKTLCLGPRGSPGVWLYLNHQPSHKHFIGPC